MDLVAFSGVAVVHQVAIVAVQQEDVVESGEMTVVEGVARGEVLASDEEEVVVWQAIVTLMPVVGVIREAATSSMRIDAMIVLSSTFERQCVAGQERDVDTEEYAGSGSRTRRLHSSRT